MARLAILAALAIGPCLPNVAHAFGGLYVAGDGPPRLADAAEVVLMRDGTRTVLTVRPTYRGPAEPFALVLPVPQTVTERDIEVLARGALDALDLGTAPRLVEYWERDPCEAVAAAAAGQGETELGATVDSPLVAGEYQIAIVAPKDAAGLEAWLRREKYQLPEGTEPLLQAYLARGMKLVVAKVDPGRVAFEDGRAVLSALRIRYESERFELPIRLGLANSDGTQDLIAWVLAPHQRYEAANYPNVTIPTNLRVTADVRDRFGAFYAALLDATADRHPGAVITEYAGDASAWRAGEELVVTRLHLRYDKSITEDLELRPAPPIAGGRESLVASGALERGAHPAPHDAFGARYTIRHPWRGPITCTTPVRGRWEARGRAQPAPGLAVAPGATVQLAHAVTEDVPELGLTLADHGGVPPSSLPATGSPDEGSGCGCQTGGASDSLWLGLVLVLVRRRRGPGTRQRGARRSSVR